MNTESIISQIDAEISRLQQAKTILAGISTKRLVGRPSGRRQEAATAKPAKRAMSAAGKAKIAKAQKARWAKVRKAAKKATTKNPTI